MSVIESRYVTVSNPLRRIGFSTKMVRSEWKTTLKTTRISNFVHIETFMLKPNQLFDDRELVFENKWLYYMVFIEFLILASIKLNIKGQHLFYELVKKGGHLLCVSGDGCKYILGDWRWVDIFYGWVGVDEGIFWMSGGGWTFFTGWGWADCVEVYFGW